MKGKELLERAGIQSVGQKPHVMKTGNHIACFFINDLSEEELQKYRTTSIVKSLKKRYHIYCLNESTWKEYYK